MSNKPILDQEIEALTHRIHDAEKVLSQLRVMLAKKRTEKGTEQARRHAA